MQTVSYCCGLVWALRLVGSLDFNVFVNRTGSPQCEASLRRLRLFSAHNDKAVKSVVTFCVIIDHGKTAINKETLAQIGHPVE